MCVNEFVGTLNRVSSKYVLHSEVTGSYTNKCLFHLSRHISPRSVNLVTCFHPITELAPFNTWNGGTKEIVELSNLSVI